MPFVSKRPSLELTEDELDQLNTIIKSRNQPRQAIERAKFILEFPEGKSISQIARDLNTNRQKLREQSTKPLHLAF